MSMKIISSKDLTLNLNTKRKIKLLVGDNNSISSFNLIYLNFLILLRRWKLSKISDPIVFSYQIIN